MAKGNGNVGQGDTSKRVKIPKPKKYKGARDAKELENFLFDVEQDFRVVHPESEEEKVSLATFLLFYNAKLWWRTHQEDIVNGRVKKYLDRRDGRRNSILRSSWGFITG